MLLEETKEYFENLVNGFIRDKRCLILVNDSDEIITCVVEKKIEDFNNLSFVYTYPQYRNKGYSKKLLSLVINDLLKDASYITLFVDKKNPVSNKLYKDLGFEIVVAMFDYSLI